MRKQAAVNRARILSLSFNYSTIKGQVQKSLEVAADRSSSCAVCAKAFNVEDSTMLACPDASCRAASHMACLARKFLVDEQAAAAVPTSGTCPGCGTTLRWVDLAKVLSLRQRGAKELSQLFKKLRSRRTRTQDVENALSSEFVVEETDDDDETNEGAMPALSGYEISLPDDWQSLADDEDAMSVASTYSKISGPSSPFQSPRATSHLKAVIDESDWDGAEVLD